MNDDFSAYLLVQDRLAALRGDAERARLARAAAGAVGSRPRRLPAWLAALHVPTPRRGPAPAVPRRGAAPSAGLQP